MLAGTSTYAYVPMGDRKTERLAQIETACRALAAAEDALRPLYPNMRDFYPRDQEYRMMADELIRFVGSLRDMGRTLTDAYLAISAEG